MPLTRGLMGGDPNCIENLIMMIAPLSSLVAPQVVIMTTCGATSDDNVVTIVDHHPDNPKYVKNA